MNPLNTLSQYTLSIHLLKLHSQYTLSIYPFNPSFQYTLSTLLTHLIDTLAYITTTIPVFNTPFYTPLLNPIFIPLFTPLFKSLFYTPSYTVFIPFFPGPNGEFDISNKGRVGASEVELVQRMIDGRGEPITSSHNSIK